MIYVAVIIAVLILGVGGLFVLGALIYALWPSSKPTIVQPPVAPSQPAQSNLFGEGLYESLARSNAEARERVARGFTEQQIGFLSVATSQPPSTLTPPKS